MAIAKIGIELEGYWTAKNRDLMVAKDLPVSWHGDGSVSLDKGDTTGETYEKEYLEEHRIILYSNGAIKKAVTTWDHRGELVSPPLKPIESVITQWVKTAYPALVNQTCGMHLHLSFTRLGMYYKTVSQAYFDAVYRHLEKWGKEHTIKNTEFWGRLRGVNQFCKKQFLPDKQVWSREKLDSRYCGVNYCYSRYKTVEIRLLPMFKSSDLAVQAVNDFVVFTNKFLSSSKLKTAYEVIEETLPQGKEEVLQLRKLLGSITDSPYRPVPQMILTRGSSATATAREALRQQVLSALRR